VYSKASLTHTEDKLPALSGLAKVFMLHLDDQYVAGLWRGDILRGVLWALMDDTYATKPQSTGRPLGLGHRLTLPGVFSIPAGVPLIRGY
jgi:hypothetical protein